MVPTCLEISTFYRVMACGPCLRADDLWKEEEITFPKRLLKNKLSRNRNGVNWRAEEANLWNETNFSKWHKLEEENTKLIKNLRAAQKEIVSQDKQIINLETELTVASTELEYQRFKVQKLAEKLINLSKALEEVEEAVMGGRTGFWNECMLCFWE